MCRSPFILPPLLLMAAAVLPATPLRAQGTPPPVDPAAVLATLKELRAKQPAVLSRERSNVLASINAAAADPAKAYEQAVVAVEFSNGSGADGMRVVEWRKKYADLLRDRDFVYGLRLQLVYLGLTWQHQTGVKTADLLAPLLDFASQVAGAANPMPSPQLFGKGIGETVFAAYFQLTPFLASPVAWESHPFNVEGIFMQTILPEMRVEKDPRLLSYWDSRIRNEGGRAESSNNALLINKFRAIRLPTLLWNRAEDEMVLGQQNQAVADMLAVVKAHPDHPDFPDWATRLETAVKAPPSPSPSAAAATPAP